MLFSKQSFFFGLQMEKMVKNKGRAPWNGTTLARNPRFLQCSIQPRNSLSRTNIAKNNTEQHAGIHKLKVAQKLRRSAHSQQRKTNTLHFFVWIPYNIPERFSKSITSEQRRAQGIKGLWGKKKKSLKSWRLGENLIFFFFLEWYL